MAMKPNDPKASPMGPQHDGKSERKPWKKKSMTEKFTEEAEKLKVEIADIETDLKGKKRELEKLEQARKLFEAS